MGDRKINLKLLQICNITILSEKKEEMRRRKMRGREVGYKRTNPGNF